MVVHLMPYKVLSVGISDIGLVRENNEDVWAKLPSQRLFILADGMGGHQAGEVASQETVKELCAILEKKLNIKDDTISLDIAREFIFEAIQEVNAHIYNMGRKDHELRGMGTTLCCLHFHHKGLVYAHVGDSRIYRLRNKKLYQLTKDHSLMRELIDLGQLNERQAEDFQYRNIITKAIGTEPDVEPSVRVTEVQDHDLYMMCSDGLSDLLSLNEIEQIMNKKIPFKEISQHLVDASKEKGGNDNITVVVAKVQEMHEHKDIPR